MAKLTLESLQTFVTAYVNAEKQAGTWAESKANLYGLIDKIGKQVTIDGIVADKLPEMNGEDLPLGKTIEEYFADFILPTEYTGDPNGEENDKPSYISVENPSYNYTLGRKKLKTTVPYDNVERAAIDSTEASNMITKITERLYQSEAMYAYNQKRQLLANMIAKAEASTNKTTLVQEIAAPVDTATAQAFIKQVKSDIEVASDVNEKHSLAEGTVTIGAAPSLVLYVKQGVIPTIEVDSLAGAFNQERLAIPAEVKVIKDFGDNATGVYAMLVDPRGVKLHNGYRAVRTHENADGDFVNFVLHTENTGFISKYTFVKVYKPAA